jgi:ParB family chromosome partitioning protein
MSGAKTEKPKHLGRGLESLLGPIRLAAEPQDQPLEVLSSPSKFPPDKELKESLHQVPIDLVSPNPFQARNTWDERDLAELAESIRANGVIQPVIVRRFNDSYQLIAGERRFRAAKLVGLTTIPAVVREVTDEQLFEWSLIENIHRRDLNPIERAQAYQRYLNSFSLTQVEAAERLGEDRSVVANYVRLLDLPEEIKQMLIDGRLSMGHARAILSLPTDELRRKLANRALAGRLSVREVERFVRKYVSGSVECKTTVKTKPAHILDLEDRLAKELGTRVIIETTKNGQKGRIIIEFGSIDDFDRITESIGVTVREEV